MVHQAGHSAYGFSGLRRLSSQTSPHATKRTVGRFLRSHTQQNRLVPVVSPEPSSRQPELWRSSLPLPFHRSRHASFYRPNPSRRPLRLDDGNAGFDVSGLVNWVGPLSSRSTSTGYDLPFMCSGFACSRIVRKQRRAMQHSDAPRPARRSPMLTSLSCP